MTATKETLSAEQSKDWKYYVRWYLDNGWVGNEARELAWRDFCKKYPEFQRENPPAE